MTGLILKDLINLKVNLKRFSLIIVLYAFLALMSKDASFFSSIFTMIFALLVISTYSYDEMAKWDVYALTLPITRDSIVQGKYLMAFILTCIGTVINVFFTLLINILMGRPSVAEGVTSGLLGSGIVLLYYCLTIPIITKLGVEKGRYLFLAFFLVPYFGAMLYKNMDKKIRIPDEVIRIFQFAGDNIAVILPIVVVIAMTISYRISVGIYRKKEF